MSLIHQSVNRFYHKPNSQYKLTLVGLDCSGKTSLLYLLKEAELVTTVPTLGLNVEEFVAPSTTPDKVSMTGWDVGTGCGGMNYMMGIIETYIRSGDALVWMVDSTDKERMSESVDKLRHFVSALEHDNWGRPAKSMPFLILANKQDLPNAQHIDNIRIAFSSAVKGKIAAVFPISLARGLGEGGGLPPAFDWLKLAIPIARSSGETKVPHIPQDSGNSDKSRALLPHQINIRSPGNLAQQLNDWLGRIENDSPPQDFLSQFEKVCLPQWDHYTHIRLAFLNLRIHGRQKGKDTIFDGIRKYITESEGSQMTTGRTYHVTMTYFWIQIVHFGIQNATPSTGHNGEADNLVDEFARFLIVNPYVVDGQLWTDYYTKEVLMSPEARARMVLPDKKPLPSIPARDSINKLTSSTT